MRVDTPRRYDYGGVAFVGEGVFEGLKIAGGVPRTTNKDEGRLHRQINLLRPGIRASVDGTVLKMGLQGSI